MLSYLLSLLLLFCLQSLCVVNLIYFCYTRTFWFLCFLLKKKMSTPIPSINVILVQTSVDFNILQSKLKCVFRSTKFHFIIIFRITKFFWCCLKYPLEQSHKTSVNCFPFWFGKLLKYKRLVLIFIFEVDISKIAYDMASSNMKGPLNVKGKLIFPLA